MQNMMKLKGTDITVWFDKPGTPGWVESIRLESRDPRGPAMSREEADFLVLFLMDEWVMSEEENHLLRACECGEDHVN